MIVAIENAFGNTSSYRDLDQDETYVVHFEDACNLHDAGYGGYTVRDRINGGLVDYRTWSREDVDLKFQRDMQALCRDQIPAVAKEARAKCLGDVTRFAIVRSVGSRFFDADLTKPGLQRKGARNNS